MITVEPPSSPAIFTLNKPSLARFFNRARQAVGLTGEVEVLLTSDAELKRLNRSFRGKNKATDVLSFPAFVPEGFPAGFPVPDTAGDLAISLETAARQAAAFGHSLEDEVRILLLHGLLHLSGLDHETDSGEMAAREDELREKLRLPNGLIARTVGIDTRSQKLTKQKLPTKTPAKKTAVGKTAHPSAPGSTAKKPARRLAAKRVRP
jgi:probable rRNA maturation factor